MLALLAAFLLLVKEPKLVEECRVICEEYGISNDEDMPIKSDDGALLSGNVEEVNKLKKAKLTSFILILASIFMWFMGYNAVTSNLSIYITRTLNLSEGLGGVISGVSMGISAIAFIPVGYLAVKIGRQIHYDGLRFRCCIFYPCILLCRQPGKRRNLPVYDILPDSRLRPHYRQC